MRYLGLVYNELMKTFHRRHKAIYTSVLVEALMRVFKNHLRRRLRAVQAEAEMIHSFESTLQSEAARVLNSIFAGGHRIATLSRWTRQNDFALSALQLDFSFSETHAKHGELLFRIAVMCGAVFLIQVQPSKCSWEDLVICNRCP